MKRRHANAGYTIVEAMIFLVITGVLLASALLVFNGRQRRTQFTQGVREIDSQIRAIMNETASGYYPGQGNLSCQATASGPQVSSAQSNSGQNKGCIFLGRVLQFSEGENYIAYTVVGSQFTSGGREVTELGDGPNTAQQTLITPASGQSSFPNLSETLTMPWGITVTSVLAPTAPNPNIGAFGFITTLGSYESSGNDLVSGTAGISVMPLAATNLTSQAQNTVTATKSLTNSQRNVSQIILCLRSGGDDRKAAIIIGGNSSNVGTEVMIDSVPEGCEGA